MKFRLTSRSPLGNENPRSITPFTTLNIVVTPLIPRARTTTASAQNVFSLNRTRRPILTSRDRFSRVMGLAFRRRRRPNVRLNSHATMSANLNLSAVLEHSARLTPERVAITIGNQHLTYAELDAQSTRVAAGLHALGVRAGDTVALSCPNVPWFPIAYFGILKSGAAAVPLNVLLKPREIAYHLKDSGAKAVLAFEGTPELPIGAMCEQAAAEARTPHVFVLPRDAATLLREPAGFQPPRREPHDTAVILYTSGTTGHPKGAELTHGNMVSNAITC